MFCKKCGNQIDDDSAFCYKCGAAVSTPAQQASVQQNAQTNSSQSTQANTPKQNVSASVPTAKIQKISAKGQEVTSTAPIESKYKIGKIITMVVFIGFSLFIPLPEDNWIVTFLLAAALLGLIGWNVLSAATMFIIRNIETLKLASYIDSENAEEILKLTADTLAKKNMYAMPCKKGSNVILINYQGRDYELYFFKEGYFSIAPDRPVSMYGFEGLKIIKMPFIYEHSLEDFPVIAYCVQEVLKKI